MSWLVHGGANWTLWGNGTVIQNGIVTNPLIEVQIENWEEIWHPDIYNLTLQVDDLKHSTTFTSWIHVFVNFGDDYADSIVTGASMWYIDGENALGPPDNLFTRLYFDYGNGHVTLDLGIDEEIVDEPGDDFIVYATGGDYVVFASNNLSASILIGNQTPLVLIGEGTGITSFDLADSNMEQARYIQIVYLTGDEIGIDALEALHFNQPSQPTQNVNYLNIIVLGSIFIIGAIVVFWLYRRFQ